MLGMDLATLSIPDLRRILEVARARNQAELADSIVAELRARAAAPATGVDEGPPAMSFGGPGAPRPVAAGLRDTPWWDDEDPDLSPRRRTPIVILGIAAAVMVAGGLGWGLTQQRAAEAETATAAATAVAPAPAPPAATPTPTQTVEDPTPAQALALEDDAPAAPPIVAAKEIRTPRATTTAAPRRSFCLTRATPADRLVCGYPALGRQHERMVAAYNRARAMSGDDPLALDAGQAKWRTVRDRVSDRRKLADLYQQRIGELDAMAAPSKPKLESDPKPDPEQPIF